MDTNFCHIIYAVRSKYVKKTKHDLKQKLLPNIFRTLIGGWNLLWQNCFNRIHKASSKSRIYSVPTTCRTIIRVYETHSCGRTRRTMVFYGMHIST